MPPEQVVYASDFPYGQQPSSLFIALAHGACAPASNEEQLRGDARRQRERARRRPCRCPSRRAGRRRRRFAQPLQLARIHQYLSMAMPLLWMRQPDTIGVLGLALNACAERDGHAGGDRADRGAARGGDASSGGSLPRDRGRGATASGRFRTMQRLLHIADIEAVTCA